MGVVYRAEDLKLGREVALKFLPEELTRDPAAVERFQREARTAAAINHSHICTIYEIGEFNGMPFLAMELLEGETLKQKIDGRPIPLEKVLDWAVQITYGLEAAHSRGIVHRDLKPANLFITKTDQAKILDFGLAKLRFERRPATAATSDNTVTVLQTDPGTMIGTPAYMSPEQARGDELDARSDLFSLGVVLYQMTTGELPFQGASAAVMMASLLRDSPTSPTQLNPEIPEGLAQIITKTLEKDPDRRYQRAAELRADLKRVAQEFGLGELMTTTTLSRAPVGVTTFRDSRRAGWLIASGVAIVIAVIAAFLATRSTPAPRILRSTQITNDRLAKVIPFLTDGSRLYFNTGTYIAPLPYEASTRGGGSFPLPLPVQHPTVLDISQDGSELLVGTDEGARPGQSPLELDELNLWMIPVLGGTRRRLGNLLVSDAALSPDGQHLVYTKGSEIGIARSDGTEPHTLVTVTGAPFFPRWSAEGKRIRFTVAHASYLVSKYSGTEFAGASLWEVSTNGTHLHRVFPGWEDAQCCGSWTRDGKYFVFEARNNGVSTIWAIRDKVSVFQREEQPVQLTTGPMDTYGPVPSPHGMRIFVGGRQPRIELLRYDSKSGTFATFLPGTSAEGLDFSRDGKWVAYVSYPDGTLWRSLTSGEERLQLSTSSLRVSLPRWSPDGRTIAFLGHDPGKPEKIFSVSADGGAVHELISAENVGDPTWSADGSQIAFSNFTPETKQASSKIKVELLNLATHQISKLPGSEGLWSPRWSPDGKHIAALSSDTTRLLLFDLATQHWTELTKAQDFGYPSWSHDSAYIYFDTVGNDAAFFRVRIRDRKMERIVALKDVQRKVGAFGPWTGLAPDDSPLLTRDSSFDEIYALDWEAP